MLSNYGSADDTEYAPAEKNTNFTMPIPPPPAPDYTGRYDYDYNILNFHFENNMHRKQLNRLGKCIGCALLVFILVQNIYPVFLNVLNLYNLFYTNQLFQNTLSIIISLCSILLPFYVAMKFESKQDPTVDFFRYGKPEKPAYVALSVPIGVLLCILASYIASFLVYLFSYTGVQVQQPVIYSPNSTIDIIIFTFQLTFSAAFIEEFALRSVVLQPLAKYGNGFAVAMSAFIFALMHQNISQFIFAFLSGLVLGYFALKTGNIWTSFFIHLIVNLFSVITELIGSHVSTYGANIFHDVFIIVTLILSVICITIISLKGYGRGRPKPCTRLTAGEKSVAYLFNLPLAAAVLILVILTCVYSL